MKSISLSGSLRKGVGKKDARESRKQGLIPCVMYGGDKEYHFSLKETDMIKAIFTPETYIINLDIEGSKHFAIFREVQYHPVSDRILHADFYEVFEDKPFSVCIPIKYEGTCIGVLHGGVLDKKMRKLSVLGLMKNIPNVIVVDVTNIDTSTPFRIQDLNLPELIFHDSPRTIIAGMMSLRKLEEKEKEIEEVEAVSSAATETAAGTEATPASEAVPAATDEEKKDKK